MIDEQRFAATKWFHAIDFGEFASSGRFKPGDPQNVTLFGTMDLIKHINVRGTDVLDIGAVDGLTSFGVRQLGARRVVATDSFARDTFELARAALDLDVEYYPGVQLADFAARFGHGQFDLIVCAGVIYHMLNPASAFFECRKLIKENGLLIVESAYEPRSDRAAMFLNSEEQMILEPHTYWLPSSQVVLGLMRLALFDVLAVRTLRSPDRITVLGRAVSPAEVSDRTELTSRIHEIDFIDFAYLINRCWPTPATSDIAYTGPRDVQLLDQCEYLPSFPFHPPPGKRTVGSTAWTTPDGNR